MFMFLRQFIQSCAMKRFNARAVLAHPKMVMNYIGMWPEVKASILYKIRGLFAFLTTTIAMILLLMKGLQDFIEGNYENGSYVLCLMLAAGHAAFKVWFLLTNKSLFFEILTNLEDPSLFYHNENFDIAFQDKIQFSKKVFTTLIILCGNAALTVAISEYVFGYNTNPRLFPIKADPSQLAPYISVWIFFTVATFYCGLIIGSFEGLVLIFLSAGIGQLQILQKEIMHAVDYYPSDINLTQEDVRYYNKVVNTELGKCVKRHNAIERFIVSIENKFSFGFLIQYGITLGVTGLIGLNFIFSFLMQHSADVVLQSIRLTKLPGKLIFSLVLASVASPDFLRCICFFIADLIQVYVVYYHCNEIILESQLVRDACYMSNWRVCGPSVRRTLFIIMERTKRPFYLTLGKFSIISIETFLVILKTSMSYFTVLKSMYVDDPNIN